MHEKALSTSEISIEHRINTLQGKRVIFDRDLAALYGTTTKRLLQQVKRNQDRFPPDFMIQLTREEFEELVTNCDQFRTLKHSRVLPRAFTEHGVVMAANVLNSDRAVQVSVLIVRAFVRMRELLEAHKDLMQKIDGLEKKYDQQFQVVFQAIRELMTPPAPERKRIGF